MFFAVVGLVSVLGAASRQVCMILLCSLMHESGHILAMCLFGILPECLTFYAGGIKLSGVTLRCSAGKRAVILLAGCAVNLSSAFISIMLGAGGTFAAVSIALGLFNLLPFRYFDGGRLYSELTGKDPPALLRAAAFLPLCVLGLGTALRGELPVSFIAAAALIALDG